MRKTNVLVRMILCASFICSGAMVAQEPMVDIDKRMHSNLAEAQRLIVEANNYIKAAQKVNDYDMKGHAEKAREFLVQVNQELKLAAEAANAGMEKKR